MSGENLTPITRKEMFLAKAAGQNIETPEPITREEMFLSKISGGGGGGATIEPLTITENGTYTAPDGVDGYSPVTVDVKGSGEELVITDFSYWHNNNARMDLLGKLDTSSSTKFGYMFQNCMEITSIPELDTSKGTIFTYMFYNCRGIISVPELDTSNGTNFKGMFYYCTALTSVPELDTSNGTEFGDMFTNCTSLTSIPKIDLSNCRSATSIFSKCQALANLYLYNVKVAVNLSDSPLLTVESIVHIIKELSKPNMTRTLTLGPVNLEKIANLYCRIIDDTSLKKTMELCESTDEGAMTLTDYASEKWWNIQ